MRLLTLPEPGVLAWVEVPLPEPGPFEVSVAVSHVGICGSDIEVFDGRRAAHRRHGHPVVGHEVSGVVDALGDAVRGPRVGDRVTCVEGWGAFSDRVITNPANLLRLPDRIDPADGCLAEVLPGVAMAAWCTGITRAHRVLVAGQGVSGLLITRLVRLHGCARLVAVDPVGQRLRLAEEFGADEVFAGTVEELAATQPEAFDLAIVATPHSVIDAVATLLRPRSRIVAYGGLDVGARVDLMALHRRSISLVKESEGINGVREARDLWSAAVSLAEVGVLALHRLRTHTVGFDDVEAAFRLRTSCAEALHVVCAHPGGTA